jgi:AcrR family transcriptional regulator
MSDGEQAAAQRIRPSIGRGERARERVLTAALDVLADDGLSGFTFEAVARRAGASKATVYRHWTSPGALLVDAMDRTFRPFPPPSTGSFESDLIELLTQQASSLASARFPRLMAAFIDAAERDPTLADLHADLTRRRREPLLHVLAHAQRDGKISSRVAIETVVDLLVGPMFYRRFIAHRPIPDTMSAAIVEHVLSGIRA